MKCGVVIGEDPTGVTVRSAAPAFLHHFLASGYLCDIADELFEAFQDSTIPYVVSSSFGAF